MRRRPDGCNSRNDRTQAVVAALRAHGESTKTQLAEYCDMSRPTVATILDDLADKNIVVALDTTADGGRPAQRFGFSRAPGIVLGVDATQNHVTVAVAKLDGTVVAAEALPLAQAGRDPRFTQLLSHIRSVLAPAISRHGALISVALSTTGIVDDTGSVVRSDLVPQWAGFPLKERLTEAFDCPVRVENDINASAYGEFCIRASEGTLDADDDVLYTSFRRGLLTGLIIGGELHRGRTWSAGEISDVLGNVAWHEADRDPEGWANRAASTLGPLCLVVDPRLVITSLPSDDSREAVAALHARLNSIRPPEAPQIPLEQSRLGTAAAVTGALALALRDADLTLFGAAEQHPTALHDIDLIRHGQQEGWLSHMPHQPSTTETRALRIGVVGVGARAPLALNAEQSQTPGEIVAVCDPHALVRDRVRDRLHKDPETLTITTTVDALIEQNIDVAFVTSPDDTHADVTCALLEAGIATYLEKPLAITLDDATRILEVAHKTGTKLYLGHNMRHMNVVRTMRDLVRAGRIGEVKAIWCRHFVGSGGDFYFKDWHATRKHGTGLLLQKAAHDIDVMHWLADTHTTEVVGMGDLMVYGGIEDRADRGNELMSDWYSLDNWPPLTQKGLNEVIDVEDLSMMLMRMESGVLASYQQCHFTPDYWRNYTVIGTEGRIENFGDGEGGVIKLWNKRTTYNPDGDEQFPILGDAQGHSDADRLIVDEALRFFVHGTRTDTNPLGAWYAVAAGIQATESLRDGSTPRAVPGLPDHLIDYFMNNQTK